MCLVFVNKKLELQRGERIQSAERMLIYSIWINFINISICVNYWLQLLIVLSKFPVASAFFLFDLSVIGRDVLKSSLQKISSVQSLSHIRLFVTPWTAAHQASLSITNPWSLLKLMPIESVMPSNHPLSSPSPPALNLSQHHGLYQ